MVPKLYIVGIGPGSKDYLTQAALNAVEMSDVVFGSKRALDLFENKIEKIELDAKKMNKSFENALLQVKDGKTVSILSTGDPGFSGILKPILKLNNDIKIEVIPGVSSIQLCAAKLLIPWDEANIITMHGKGNSEDVLGIINNGKPSIILPDFNPAKLAEFLIKNGIDKGRKTAVCEKLSYKNEKVVEGSLEDIQGMEFSYMSVMVIY
ncbi:MAG: precorrin-6y C5,15-methyltransferase (decarboxylating) subunit CbiE [Methanobacterium sp.]